MTASPPPPCGRRFDEELLSGYLDGVLTQQERQAVTLHLEGCPACRELFDDLRAMREAARGTAFALPPDEQWSELPRTAGSRALRLGGFSLLVVWLLMLVAGVGVELARSRTPTWVTLLVVGAGAAFLLLLFSALLDRLHDMRHDRYRRVQK